MMYRERVDQGDGAGRGAYLLQCGGRLRPWLLPLLLAWVLREEAHGQGRLDAVLRTGDPAGFSQWAAVLPLPSQPGMGITVEFDCGVASEGRPASDGVGDSLTGWLSDAAGRQAAVLFQVDALEFVLAPRSAGFLAMDASRFVVGAASESPPTLGFTPLAAQSRHVSFQLPDAFEAQGATFHLSLLEDMDDDPSVGWVSNLRVVPEPQGLIALGAILMMLSQRRRISAGRRRGPMS